MENEPWKWWVGSDGETYDSGPLETRDEAVRIASEEMDGGHIVEAYQEPIDLSKSFSASSWLEETDERLLEDFGGENGPDSFLCAITKEQEHDLEECIRMTIERWQKRHSISVVPWLFSAARNHEYIEAKDETDGQ